MLDVELHQGQRFSRAICRICRICRHKGVVHALAPGRNRVLNFSSLRIRNRYRDRFALNTSFLSWLGSYAGRGFELANAPLPHAVINFLVKAVAHLRQQQADLAPVVAFVRYQVAHEGHGVRLEALDFAPCRESPTEERLYRLA
jgi:hypothetical protein